MWSGNVIIISSGLLSIGFASFQDWLKTWHDIRLLSEWKGCEVIELNVQADHVHLVISIPPKVSVSELMAVRRCGTLKGKLAIKLFKSYPQLKKKPYWGNHFWARGYFVNTVGINEDHIRRYVKYQEAEDRKEETNNQDFNLFEPPL